MRLTSKPMKEPPMRSFKELVDELGVEANVLANMLSKDPSAPKSIERGRGVTRNKWFRHSEFLAWYKKQV